MNKEELLKKIKAQAKKDAKNRRDPRFLNTMGFLVAKGFLFTNYEVPRLPNKKLKVEDAVWAGKNVEPRILEVLPAAVLRLQKHFDLDPVKHTELARVVNRLKKNEPDGEAFCGMPYAKIRIWANNPLKDRRVKTVNDKRIQKLFRLTPEKLVKLKQLAIEQNCSETEVLEKLLN